MPYFMISAFCVMAAFCLPGTLSFKKVKSAGDYAVSGQKAGALSVAGVLMGTLVSGGSTVGTVQMAYECGLSGWWFTLGSGIGCCILGLRFARPIRETGLTTLPEFVERNYGRPTAFLTLGCSIAGTLLSVVAQFMAGIALLRSVFPLSQGPATFILSLMVLFFILTGGLKGFSILGNVKIVMLYLVLALCVMKAAAAGQSAVVLVRELPFSPWLNLLGRGAGKDLGAGISLVLGILCTQIYIQAVFSASDERVARQGCLIAALLIPPLGLMSVWVGLAMRNSGTVVEAAQALPFFLKTQFHPAVGGALWAALVITAVGGAAGLCLGVATNLTRDIGFRIPGVVVNEKSALRISRLAVFLTVAASAWMALAFHGGLILHLSYLALSLRSSGMIIPLFAAIFRPGFLAPGHAFASSLTGFAGMFWAWFFFPAVEPLYVGLLASGATFLICCIWKRAHTERAL